MASLIIFLFLAAILSSSTIQTQAAQLHNDFRKCLYLHPANSRGIYTPNNLRLLPSTSTHGPQAIVAPDHESQIQSVVLCAKKMGMKIQSRSGGHDLTSAASRDPFIIIDLVNLNEITVDADSKTAWVQAGATLEQLNSRIAEKSKKLAVPAGIGSTSGVGGRFSGSDHIVDARFVDVEGRILDRESMGENLFLAIRVAGLTASFGVVTAYKVNLVTVPEIISLPSDTKTLEETGTDRKWQSNERIVGKLNQTFPKLGASDDDVVESFHKCFNEEFEHEPTIPNIISTQHDESFLSDLQSSIRNLRFKLLSTTKPKVIITPESETQIPPVIVCAKENKLQIRTRSGGHDYEGLSYSSEDPLASFVLLDMRKLNRVSVNVKEKTAWVGAGATLGELYYEINDKSKGTLGFPGGACPTVGAGGLISGGGYGMMTRKHGVAADNVLDARIIVADGRILNKRSMHEALYWAIRGGGGASFGVILDWKLQLVDVPEQVTVFSTSRIMDEEGIQLVEKWQEIADKLDEDLFLRVRLRRARPEVNNGGKASVNATFEALYLGGIHGLMEIMKKDFPALRLEERDCQKMSWIQSILFFDRTEITSNLDVLKDRTGTHSLKYYKVKSDYVRKPINRTGLEVSTRFFKEEEAKDSRIFLSPNGGEMYKKSESEIAFPHRKGSVYSIEYTVQWGKDEAKTKSTKYTDWMKNLYSEMTPYVSQDPRAAYYNHRDLEIGKNNKDGPVSYDQARVWGLKYFKNNFRLLAVIKTLVDPDNFFRNEQSIPTIRIPSMSTKAEA